jgi:hypothetical protein
VCNVTRELLVLHPHSFLCLAYDSLQDYNHMDGSLQKNPFKMCKDRFHAGVLIQLEGYWWGVTNSILNGVQSCDKGRARDVVIVMYHVHK